ncbi:MAG: EAL domain-containing protein [Lachnospiraceae bacterium]|nr:EAL domain-containing protein [Lachnospiraceae bacterium]
MQNNSGQRSEFGLLYGEILKKEEIMKIQEQYCEASGVITGVLDGNCVLLTGITGNEHDRSILKPYITEEMVLALADRVRDDFLEDQAIEDTTASNVKIAAVSMKYQGKSVLTWIVAAVLSDDIYQTETAISLDQIETAITEKQFYRQLDLLFFVSNNIFGSKIALIKQKESLERLVTEQNGEEGNALGISKQRADSLTRLVQLLDDKSAIDIVLEHGSGIIGEYLQADSVQVYQVNKSDNTINVAAEWCRKEVVSFFDKTFHLPRFSFLHADKPYTISTNTVITDTERKEIEQYGIRALAAFPIIIGGEAIMYICVTERTKDRTWNLEDIRFVNDATRLLRNIILQRIQRNSLASSYESLEAVLDNIGCGVYVRDRETNEVLFLNANMKNMLAGELEEDAIDHVFEAHLPKDRESYECELLNDQNGKWYSLHYSHITWMDGRKVALYAISDVSEKKRYQGKIEQQAYTDFLTGLYNRLCCERDLAYCIDESKKNQTTSALLYLDLDDFKHINDGLGHQYGDVLLKAIAHSLQRVGGITNNCYRMGGDEFVIIVPPENIAHLSEIVQGIKNIFGKPWFLKDADYYCTMSMGIVYFPQEGDNVQDLIKKADIAMYEAKKAGKNRVANYTEKLSTVSNERLNMERNMRDAARHGFEEFEVYFQPITDLSFRGSGKPHCSGAEALIRWNSSKIGFMSPSDFIPLAEYLGLINPMGNFVLLEACKECRYWNEHGFPDYKVNVNLSVVQLLQPDIQNVIERAIEETGVNPRNLTLEVTESLAINDMDRMKEVLEDIKKLKCRIALDDFGTGYSSLNHIREIPFDVIKVDQGFVRDLAENAYSQAFVKMVAELAETLGKMICVEGVETRQQMDVLYGMKVRLIQGYYFGKPMPKKEFREKFLKPVEQEMPLTAMRKVAQ